MDLTQIVRNVVMTRATSVKPYKGADTSKNFTVKCTIDGVTLADVFYKAVSTAVIAWQNNVGRKQYDNLTDGQVIDLKFSAPGTTTIDPEQAMVAKLQAMNAEEQAAYIANMLAKVSK